MYFFDFADYCYSQVIGTNSVNIFTTPTGGICSDMATTYRATRDSLLIGVTNWYNLSNPYVSVYEFGGGTKFWPASTAGYTLYTGGWTWNGTVGDDGYTTTPIKLPAKFKVNGLESIDLYVSTNGYFTLNEGRFVYPTSPNVGPPATMAGNPGDNWLQPGLFMPVDSTTQNLYYQTGSGGGGRYYVSLLVYGGRVSSPTTPTSWLATFYKDINYQWFEVQVKPTSTIQGLAGPYNATSVAVSPSTLTKVWRGDLNGQNWTYMGEGVVNATAAMSPTPRVCPECDTYYNQFISATTVGSFVSNFWLDADNNFANKTQSDFTTFVQEMYHQQCLLKQLLKCVDGDTFPTFTNFTFGNYE